jgi:hypothetical protein
MMNNRRSCVRRTPPNRTRLCAILLGAAALWLVPSARAGAPDWLKTAARQAVPTYPKDAIAVVLFSEEIVTVKNSGEIETIYRMAIKILRPEARDRYGTFGVHFDKETRLTYLKAWCIPANGKEYEVKEKDAVETQPFEGDLYSDIHYKYLTIPAADPGNVIGYEYVQKNRPFILEYEWSFQHVIPVLRARFTLQLPAGWEYKAFWSQYPEAKPQQTGQNQFTWELTNVPLVEIEPDMPPWRAVAGRLALKYFTADAAQASNVAGSWHDLGLWYASLTTASRQPTPEIKQKVVELTAGLSGPLEKMKALTSFMQRQIRYVAIEIGIGGVQPHSAAEVFKFRYGDCKDKATLLSTMLHEIGVESYYVVIHTDRGMVLPEFASPVSFNHVILAIRLPQDTPAQNLYAVIDHAKLGKLLFFDPTNPYTPLGYIPSYLQDNYGLLVTPDGGDLLKLPLSPPATNRLLRSAKLTLSASGTLSGDVQEIRWGAPAAVERAQFLSATVAERPKLIENFLNSFLTGWTLTKSTVGNLEKYDEALTMDYRFMAENYAKFAGNLLVLRPRVLGAKESSLLEIKPRKYSFAFDEATLQNDDFEIALPPGYVVDDVPAPVKTDYDFGNYSSEVIVSGNTLHYKRKYEIKDVIVPVQRLDELKKFFRQIASDERSSAVLRRVSP